MRAFVELPAGLDYGVWAQRYQRGEVPDLAPWGLHRLSEFGVQATLRPASLTRSPDNGRLATLAARAAASARHRTSGLEFAELGRGLFSRARREADVVLCYDERTGIPAALVPPRLGPPTVTGVGWLTTRAVAPPLHARLAALALPRAAAVFTQCRPVLDLLTREWQVPADRAHFVPVGIDTDFYAELAWPDLAAPDAAPVIASAGEDRFRDHDVLIAATARLRSRWPGIRLDLATTMPLSYPDGLVAQYTERMDGRMRELYGRASLVAVALKPTPTGSGLSVILEAMASGRPVVCTANPGLSDYVRDGVDGILVPDGDSEAFATAMGELLADPQRARAMGRAAAQRAREHFSSQVMAARLAELVRAVS